MAHIQALRRHHSIEDMIVSMADRFTLYHQEVPLIHRKSILEYNWVVIHTKKAEISHTNDQKVTYIFTEGNKLLNIAVFQRRQE